jgi:hypothetical protein
MNDNARAARGESYWKFGDFDCYLNPDSVLVHKQGRVPIYRLKLMISTAL